MNKQSSCPCGSGRQYGACCGPCHEGRRPALSAEALMRSRFCAFALGRIEYLVATHHPDFREKDELKSLKKTLRGVRWLSLEIVDTKDGQGEALTGEVEFRARYAAGGGFHFLHERSRFSRENGQWFYRDGDLRDDEASAG